MSDYVKITDYAAKDALLSGNPAKLVKGTEIGADFDAVAAAVATKFDSSDLGVIVQAYDADLATWSGVTPAAGITAFLATPSSANLKTAVTDETGSGALVFADTPTLVTPALGAATATSINGTTIPSSKTLVVTTDIGTTVQAYDVDTAKTDVAQTFTASQRGTATTDNDGSFDQSVTNNFICTPTGNVTLTFTNHTSGQSGFVLFVNTGGYTGHAVAATTKVDTSFLSTINATGTYLISYFDNGTNAYCVTSKVLA